MTVKRRLPGCLLSYAAGVSCSDRRYGFCQTGSFRGYDHCPSSSRLTELPASEPCRAGAFAM
jgi:hypothetical protein